jgi:prepilin-type N-terminal cleavage/methylation domain-containing protein
MIIPAGPKPNKAGRGFTLVELLLAVALVLLLLGGIMLNFPAMQRGADLEEGGTQFESLLRFARSQAASTGRQVRLDFESGMTFQEEGPKFTVRLMWEPDPIGQPGMFEDVPEAGGYLRSISDLVEVKSCKAETPPPTPPGTTGPAKEGGSPVGTKAGAEVGWNADDDMMPATFHVHFFPDGSSESADIVLGSHDAGETRAVLIRLIGVTGVIRRRLILPEETNGEKEAVEADQSGEAEQTPKSAESVKPEQPVQQFKRERNE